MHLVIFKLENKSSRNLVMAPFLIPQHLCCNSLTDHLGFWSSSSFFLFTKFSRAFVRNSYLVSVIRCIFYFHAMDVARLHITSDVRLQWCSFRWLFEDDYFRYFNECFILILLTTLVHSAVESSTNFLGTSGHKTGSCSKNFEPSALRKCNTDNRRWRNVLPSSVCW